METFHLTFLILRLSPRLLSQASAYCAECERWRTLIQNNIGDIDAVNSVGDTALHIAARNGKTTMALLLLEAGANAHLTNYAGETPLKMAAECARAAAHAARTAAFPTAASALTTAVVTASGALTLVGPSPCDSPRGGHTAIVTALIQCGVDVNLAG